MTNLDAFHRWIDGAPFEEMQALEFEGRLHFPETLKRRDAKGKLVEVPITVRVPRQEERAKARVDARKWCEKIGLDPEKNADHLDSFDTLCLCARAIRDAEPPHAQHMLPQDLVGAYDTRSLLDVWDRVNFYDRLIDPRPDELDDATFEKLVHAMRRAGNLRPLAAIAGSAQDSFVVRMASELSSFLTARSSAPSPEISISDS